MASANIDDSPEVCILYAPPPDGGEDASAVFAERASRILDEAGARIAGVEELAVPDGGGRIGPPPAGSRRLVLFLISCAADGSVGRVVRKAARGLAERGKGSAAPAADEYAVALLGHARCDNSARQMRDTIFRAGHRFERTIGASSQFSDSGPCSRTLEAQVELRGPEEEFDPWVKEVAKCLSSS